MTSPTSACFSAPGSLMLFGEHAVLHGETALCAAVDQRMRVSMHLRDDREVHIESELGSYQKTLDTLTVEKPFTFLLRALQQAHLERGVTIHVEAEFGDRVGLGSSSAVTVAAVGALRELNGQPMDRSATFLEAREIIRFVQGRGSGADAAAASYGGIVCYAADPVEIEALTAHPPVSLLYAGYKTPTPKVIEHVNRLAELNPERFNEIYGLIGQISRDASEAIRQGDLLKLGQLMNLHHGLQEAIGTSDPILSQLVHGLRQLGGVLGAKISGSGLGDCVLALGIPNAEIEGFERIPVKLGGDGLTRE